MSHPLNPDVAVDLDPKNRPGVPMELEPRLMPGARAPITRQVSDVKVFRHGRPGKTMPPVYGTAQPPSGLSGMIRAFAYRYPDHWARHWTTLLLADRVDVWEHRLKNLAAIGAIGAAALLVGRRLAAAR